LTASLTKSMKSSLETSSDEAVRTSLGSLATFLEMWSTANSIHSSSVMYSDWSVSNCNHRASLPAFNADSVGYISDVAGANPYRLIKEVING